MERAWDKLRRAYGETGLAGVTRRATRITLEHLGGVTNKLAEHLYAVEASARLTSDARSLLLRNQTLANVRRGERCFIVGTGPSIARQELEVLAGEVTFGVNSFYRHAVVDHWQPTYYVLIDGVFFNGDSGTEKFFRELRARVPQSVFFAPVEFRDVTRDMQLLPLDRTHFLALYGEVDAGFPSTPDLTEIFPAVRTVVQAAVFVALYMGFEEIYLLGCDHDWLASSSQSGHFHAGSPVAPASGSRFALGQRNYGQWGKYVSQVWDCYERLHDMAQRRGSRIFNATEGGCLDVFERVSLEDVVTSPRASASG